MCYKCGSNVDYDNCKRCNPCNSINSNGCPVNLDFTCVFYHKDNNQISNLTGLGLSNGATLQLVVESIDEKIKQLNVPTWSLPRLRTSYVINTLRQFGESVDLELTNLQTQITGLVSTAATPLVAGDSATVDFSTSGTLGHNLTASVKISATAGNRASVQSDGVMVTPQTLAADYVNKKISIAGGNEIDMLNFCGCEDCFGFLGNLTADPTDAENGQMWFRTDLATASGLKIKLNGAVRTITTS